MTTTEELIITKNVESQLNGNKLLPIVLMAQRGTGKSSFVRQLAKDLNTGIVEASIPSMTLEKFQGIPTFVDTPDFAKYRASGNPISKGTDWTVPELIVQTNALAESHGSCILFLDDLHKLNKITSAVMYELLLERRLGDYLLHPNVAIICAMNSTEESGAEHMEEPIKDRLQLMHIEFDFNYWFPRFGIKLNYFISSFLKLNQQFCLEGETVDFNANGSPRSWENLSNELSQYNNDQIEKVLPILARANISNIATDELIKHITYILKIDFTSIVKKKTLQDVSELSHLDRILWAYIINYIITPADALYLIDLINHNNDNSNSLLWKTYLVAELIAKETNPDTTDGQKIVIDVLLNRFDKSKYAGSDKVLNKLSQSSINNSSKLLQEVSKYII